MSRVRARLERVERLARGHLPHAGDVLASAWRSMPDAELFAFARLIDGTEEQTANTTANRLWPAIAEHHEALTRTMDALDHLPRADGRWFTPLPQPSDEAIREALDVLDSSAPPEGEHAAWTVAKLAARLTLAVRDVA